MQLVLWRQVNIRFFASGSRPSKKDWEQAIKKGEVHGKIMLDTVYIDIDDFLSRDDLSSSNEEYEEMSLL